MYLQIAPDLFIFEAQGVIAGNSTGTNQTITKIKMKKIILLISLFWFNSSFSQTPLNYDEIRLENSSDYAAADSFALAASNFLLSTPFEKDSPDRLKSLQFIIKWMTGTPDYSFSLDNTASKILKDSDDLLGLYMACMTKFCLENKASSKDKKLIKLNSMKLLLAYCENPENNIKMTRQLKKISEANKKGELEKEL